MDTSSAPCGTVVLYSNTTAHGPRGHEKASRDWIAARVAALKGYEYGGEFDPARSYAGHLYFVPADTLTSVETAHELGIRAEEDLFGGVVPYPFVATKAITHPLIDAQARAPEGWSLEFGRRVHDSILLGYAAFAPDDARRACERILKSGPARIKRTRGIGGRGQWTLTRPEELDAALAEIEEPELERYGVVIEQQLEDVATYSVGQARVAGLVASYYGTQRMTTANDGQPVYGGSDLVIVRGGYDALLERDPAPEIRTAVEQAMNYDAAVAEFFPGWLASRRNYDIARGRDPGGQWRSGVLEQSWRIGGATAAEIAALEAFLAAPSLQLVRASTHEVHGVFDPPADAVVQFQGMDERIGPITKYSVVSEAVA